MVGRARLILREAHRSPVAPDPGSTQKSWTR
jgi:hypothetical protein